MVVDDRYRPLNRTNGRTEIHAVVAIDDDDAKTLLEGGRWRCGWRLLIVEERYNALCGGEDFSLSSSLFRCFSSMYVWGRYWLKCDSDHDEAIQPVVTYRQGSW